MTFQGKVDQLLGKREEHLQGGGEARVDAQHKRGKLTARERLDILLDEGSFEELDSFVTHRSTNFGAQNQTPLGDSVITGYGTIDGRLAYVFAQDFTIFGGSVSEAAGEKIVKIQDLALKNGAPVIGLNDGGGARIHEGVESLNGYGEIFTRNVISSGVIPQISVVMGPAAGGAVYSPAITDFIFMTRSAQMYITGPDVVRAVTGEEVSHQELGGFEVHSSRSGVAHFTVEGEEACLQEVRRLLTFLPSNNMDDPLIMETGDDPRRPTPELQDLVPADATRPYDTRDVIQRVVDAGDFMEVQAHWGANIVVGFARLAGRSIGVVANQPAYLAGVLDIDASRKGARFVRFCDCFNIPILTFVDVPGYLPGTTQEYGGIIVHGAKLLYAYAEATVPKVSVVLRKGYGGAYLVMGSKQLRGDINYAWPIAEAAVTGSEAAVDIIHRERIRAAADSAAERKRLIDEYNEQFQHPYIAASRGFIDDVILPAETRVKVIRAFDMLQNKADSNPPRKHGNIPL
jgi:propionyl-CoA carboxylase beta chain